MRSGSLRPNGSRARQRSIRRGSPTASARSKKPPERCSTSNAPIRKPVRNFEILFDSREPSICDDPAYARYGNLGFPPAPGERPWIYSNFVQSLDGIVSFKGRHSTGGDISQLAEDRWLMDLLRSHADAVLLGINTLMEETQLLQNRGPVYSIEDIELRSLRDKLDRGREKNIFVTGAAYLDLSDYRVFDPGTVETFIITTTVGARRLAQKSSHPHIKVVVAGEGTFVD